MKEQEGGHQTIGLTIIPTLPFIIIKIMMKVKLIMKAPTIMMKMRMDCFRLPQESLPHVRFKKKFRKGQALEHLGRELDNLGYI